VEKYNRAMEPVGLGTIGSNDLVKYQDQVYKGPSKDDTDSIEAHFDKIIREGELATEEEIASVTGPAPSE